MLHLHPTLPTFHTIESTTTTNESTLSDSAATTIATNHLSTRNPVRKTVHGVSLVFEPSLHSLDTATGVNVKGTLYVAEK